MKWIQTRAILFILILLWSAFAVAATTTTFTFRVPTTRSLSITYGGSCNSSAFFFNEADANFDPDPDGNASKIKPSSARASTIQYDFNRISNPSPTHVAYGGGATNPPTANDPPTEFGDSNYVGIWDADANVTFDATKLAITITNISGKDPTQRFVFSIGPAESDVTDINFYYVGSAQSVSCAGSGLDRDYNVLIYNYDTTAFELVTQMDNGSNIGAWTLHHVTARLSGDLTPYIAPDRNMMFAVNARTSNGNLQCIYSDYVQLTVAYGGPYCQSSTLAPMTLSNTGNVDINVDGNFASAFSGNDVNVVLKAWMGTGSGCGTVGMGGWEKDCSVSGTTTPLSATQCKNFNQFNSDVATRLVTKLAAGDTNQLCFSGDLNALVFGGDHNQTFQTGADFS